MTALCSHNLVQTFVRVQKNSKVKLARGGGGGCGGGEAPSHPLLGSTSKASPNVSQSDVTRVAKRQRDILKPRVDEGLCESLHRWLVCLVGYLRCLRACRSDSRVLIITLHLGIQRDTFEIFTKYLSFKFEEVAAEKLRLCMLVLELQITARHRSMSKSQVANGQMF